MAWIIGLLVAIISPPHGLGFTMCWFEAATGVPCPGCGLTRSLSCAIRGMFLESWHYHPLGLVILGLFLFTTIQTMLPAIVRNRFLRHMRSQAALYQALYITFVAAFVLFGAARALLECRARLL